MIYLFKKEEEKKRKKKEKTDSLENIWKNVTDNRLISQLY